MEFKIKILLLLHRNSWINHLIIYATTILFISLLQQPCNGQQQKFRTTPQDMQVLEGSEALMRCEITNLAGQVQWVKDGFALGFSGVIPGFPRYTILGDRKQGVFNLRISNASIEDNAEYQCQVGPAKLNSAIRANAKLNVISPPASIEIQGYSHNSKVEVRENQNLSLLCVVANAKPAAQIVWYRGNTEYNPENREDKVVEINGKRFTTTSRLSLKPTSDDDYTEYTCQAKHKALPSDMPMKSTVQLSVLYPPGPPYIEGYTQGETLRRGQTVELVCRSRGGNPPAQLIWYKNNTQVQMGYRTHGRLSENVYSFLAQASDNKARFRCEASNVMLNDTPLKAEVDLLVLFAPTHVSISGLSEAKVGDVVSLTCTTAPSNPPADIKWMVGGRHFKNTTSRTVVSPEGGWITVSNITAVIEPNKRSLVVVCHGLNMQLTENVVSTHTVNVLYAPSPPLISGYIEGQIIPAGSVQKLLCVSSGGNPLATLVWYKNDKKISSTIRKSDNSVSAEISILANVTDNQARYRCEAHNSATEIPLFESTVLSVHFAPDTVKIRLDPEELKPDTEATLICDSSSSNPPAQLSWWREGIPINGFNNSSKPGLWGGTVSTLELKVNLTQEMNGVVYTCQSTNDALQRSVHEAIKLDVLYPPQFLPPPSSTVVGVEGESLQVSLKANANPMTIIYTWTKDSQPIAASNSVNKRIMSDGPILNITKLERGDAGVYTCRAKNAQGKSEINVTIVVEYATSIKSISENVIVEPGEDALLTCTVDGKPLTEEHVKWERLGYDMSAKTMTTFANGTSSLHIKNAQRSDVGNFRCIADNRVTNPTNRDVLLIVNFAPEIDTSPGLLRAASGAGERGRLPCRARASPQPKFKWYYGGNEINVSRMNNYDVEDKKIDPLTYESTLIIQKVAPADYGEYKCVAVNNFGSSNESVSLDVTSPPDPPLSLNILNTTHDTVTLTWTPGFDGGLKAKYRVRYREISSDQYRYIDGLSNSHKLVITGLRMNTAYLFSVMAFNELGQSKYLPDLARAQTKEIEEIADPLTEPTNPQLPTRIILGIALASFGLLLVNAAVVAWYFVKKNRSKETSAQNTKSHMEMYPNSYNDTMTGETVSCGSEKTDSYSNDGSTHHPDFIDETRKKATSTYLLENSDIPPPRYQKDTGMPSFLISNSAANSRTLPHPRHHHNTTNMLSNQTRDDQMLVTKGAYIPSPSPAPPIDGSYYNMSSERYLSYPPLDYPISMDYTPPLPSLQNATIVSTGGGTLRRGIMRGMIGVPPPDVTHHTTPPPSSSQQQPQTSLLHDFNPTPTLSGLGVGIGVGVGVGIPISTNLSNLSQMSPQQTSTPISNAVQLACGTLTVPKQPQSILKDPNRPKTSNIGLVTSMGVIPGTILTSSNPVNGGINGNMQILNVSPGLLTTATTINGSIMSCGGSLYDPNTSSIHSLQTFSPSISGNNASNIGFTDSDGHLV
ncbi:NPHS1.2 family protein [Megaselia abdita]